MRKWLIFVAALAVAASACGGEDSTGAATSLQPAETSTSASPVDTTVPEDTAAPEPASGETETPETTAAPSEPPPEVEGPSAPDFALALADGSEFMLSAEQKPVYLVFWAEW